VNVTYRVAAPLYVELTIDGVHDTRISALVEVLGRLFINCKNLVAFADLMKVKCFERFGLASDSKI
jgi:hypothetical protein